MTPDEQFIEWRIERLADKHGIYHSCPIGALCDYCWQALLDEIDCNPRIK